MLRYVIYCKEGKNVRNKEHNTFTYQKNMTFLKISMSPAQILRKI